MDAHFDPDFANEKSTPKKRTAIATIALSALVGVAGGLGAFGIANSMRDGDPEHTASAEAERGDAEVEDKNDKSGTESGDAETKPADGRSEKKDGKDKDKDDSDKEKSESLVPVTTKPAPSSSSSRNSGQPRTTKTVTQTHSVPSRSGNREDVRSGRPEGDQRGEDAPTTGAAPQGEAAGQGAHDAAPTTSAPREEAGQVRADNVGNGAEMSVVPEPVSRPITTTANTSAPAAPTTTTAVPTTTAQQGAVAGQPQPQPTTMTPAAQQRGQEGAAPAQGGASQSQVPVGPPPAPQVATNEELDRVLRSATSPATEDKDRVAQFEQGEAARPVIERFMSLSTGSVPLLGWNLQGPVQVRDGRAETRLKLHTPLPTPDYPAIFIWRGGRWVVSAETTCELARNLQLPCPA